LGDHLGDLTNEISKNDGSHIIEIVCGGPKNYAYITDAGVSKCVVKGFSLSVTTKLVVVVVRVTATSRDLRSTSFTMTYCGCDSV